MGQRTSYSLYKIICQCIAQYYSGIYKYEKLAYNGDGKNICIDESLFVHSANGRH